MLVDVNFAAAVVFEKWTQETHGFSHQRDSAFQKPALPDWSKFYFVAVIFH